MLGNKITNRLIIFAMIFHSGAFATKLTIVTEHLAPYQIVSSNSVGGLSTEIVETVLRESGYDYSIEAYPWSLSFQRAIQEQNTCIYSLARIPVREKMFQWIGHIADSAFSFYALKNKNISIASLEEAKNYKTAVIKDDVSHHFLLSKGFIENEHFYVMNNYDALLKLLEVPSRNIDAVIINEQLISYRISTSEQVSKYKDVYTLEELSINFHLACSLKTDQNIVNNLIGIMEKLEQQGTFTKIREKWQDKMVK